MSGEQLLVDLNTLGSVRCETWNRKARLDLQDRVMETLQGEETLSILEQFGKKGAKRVRVALETF